MTDQALAPTSSREIAPPKVFEETDLQTWHSGLSVPVHKVTKMARLVLLLVFCLGSIWASVVPIGGAVIASGKVVTEGRSQVVQSLDPGKLAAIDVREGQRVKAGDVVARLDVTPLMIQRDALEVRQAILRIQLARRQAGIANLADMEVPTDIPAEIMALPRVAETVASQRSEYLAMREFVDGEIRSLDIQIENLRRDNRGLEGVLESLRKQEAQTRELADGLQELYEKDGTVSKMVLNRERESLYRVEAEIKRTEVQLEQNQGLIEEAVNRKSQVRLNILRESESESVQLQTSLNSVEQELGQVRERLARSDLMAPADGTVTQIHLKTIGAVIRPGETIMDIFPVQDKLFLEVKVKVGDVQDVYVDQPARVQFGKIFSGSPVTGTVRFVSDDIIPETGPAQAEADDMYLVYVEVDDYVGSDKVYPGNKAQIYLKKEPRTFFEVITGPFSRLEFNAFKN